MGIRTTNPYQITRGGTTNWINLSSKTYELYTDGNEFIRLWVKVYNNANIASSGKEITFTTSKLRKLEKHLPKNSYAIAALCFTLQYMCFTSEIIK